MRHVSRTLVTWRRPRAAFSRPRLLPALSLATSVVLGLVAVPIALADEGVHAPTLGADGEATAYVADQPGSIDLYAVPAVGGPARRLNDDLSSGDEVLNFVLTPDSATVVYTAGRWGDHSILSRPLVGGSATLIHHQSVYFGDWSPLFVAADSSRVIFRGRQGGTLGLPYLVSAPIDGTDGAVLTPFPNFWLWVPASPISPDSTKVLFVADDESGVALMASPITGGATTKLVHYRTGPPPLLPAAFTPDSASVVYVADDDEADVDELYVVSVGGGTPLKLNGPMATGGDVTDFTLSPDGSHVVYLADQDVDDLTKLYVVPVGGGASTPLAWEPRPEGIQAAFTPDGASLVYVADSEGDDAGYVLHVSSISGGIPLQLTNGGDITSLAISPDGSRVVYLANGAADTTELYVVPISGGPSTKLNGALAADGDVTSFEIHPDGSRVVYLAEQDAAGTTELYVVPISGGPSTKLNGALAADGDVTSFEISRDGSRVVYLADQATADAVGLVDPFQGQWHLRNTAGTVTSFYYGNPGDVPFMGDWDCDGVGTPGLFRASDAFAYLRNSNTQGIADIRFFFGNPSDVPLVGDWDGDGCDTLSIYRPSEQRFYIVNALGANEGGLGPADYSFLFGNPGDRPVAGDWDGDGIDEVGLHRESTGFFYWRDTLTTGIADGEIFFGDPQDRFVAGDWGTVDGLDTPAIFRPSDLTFYFRHTLTQGIADSQFAWTGAGSAWLPISGAFGLDQPMT